MEIMLEIAELAKPAMAAPSFAGTPQAAPADVAKFQHFMEAPPSAQFAVEMVPGTQQASLDKAGEAIRIRAQEYINNVSADRKQLDQLSRDMLKNLDFNDPKSQLVMLNFSAAMMRSSTELTFITGVGQSVEKNTKMLFQAQT
jgi:hypothetical protein